MASFWYKGYSVQVFCCQCKSDVICFMWCWWRDPIFCVWSSIFPLLLEWRKHKETGNKRLQWNFYNSVHQKDIKGVGLIPPLLLHMTASNKLLQCDANGCPISAECAAQQNIQTCPMKVYRLGTNGTLPWAGTQRLSIVTRERQRLLPMGQQATGRTNSWITQYQSPKHSVQPSQHVYFIVFFFTFCYFSTYIFHVIDNHCMVWNNLRLYVFYCYCYGSSFIVSVQAEVHEWSIVYTRDQVMSPNTVLWAVGNMKSPRS